MLLVRYSNIILGHLWVACDITGGITWSAALYSFLAVQRFRSAARFSWICRCSWEELNIFLFVLAHACKCSSTKALLLSEFASPCFCPACNATECRSRWPHAWTAISLSAVACIDKSTRLCWQLRSWNFCRLSWGRGGWRASVGCCWVFWLGNGEEIWLDNWGAEEWW